VGGGGDTGLVGMDVGVVHHTGATIASRSSGAATAAKSLHEGLDSAHTTIGHPVVRQQMAAFLTEHISEHARRLGPEVTAAGDHVAGVAATARSSDESGAGSLTTPLSASESTYGRINREVLGTGEARP
jgi:hypothetical protein